MSKPFDEIDPRAEAFGERLRREREMRGVSLEAIAGTTKVSTRLLRALEAGQFDLLPGGIFNKNYVRAYARHLGIDEEQAVADYLEAAQETPPDVRLIAHQNAAMHDRYGDNAGSGFPLLPVFILLVVIVGGAGGWYLYRQRQRERAQAVPPPVMSQTASVNSGLTPAPITGTQTAGVAPPSTVPGTHPAAAGPPAATPPESKAVRTVEAAESSKPATAQPVPKSDESAQAATPFAVTIRARDSARVEVRSDGEVVVRGTIEPDEIKTFHATNRLVLWTANPDQLEISFNGKHVPLSAEGSANGEQVLVFTSRGLVPRAAAQ